METREIKKLKSLLKKYYDSCKNEELNPLGFNEAATKEVLADVEAFSEMIEIYESEEN
jgi:hypothetical protein